MIFTTTPFAADEPEGSAKSQYMSKKDMKIIGIGIVALLVISYPIYGQLYENRNDHLCRQNLGQISKAMGLYAEENDQRFPPAYEILATDTPLYDNQNRPFVWASLITRYMNGRSSLECPSASKEELTKVQHPTDAMKTLDLGYGMYGVYSTYSVSHVSNPDDAVIIAETSNHGAAGSFDPTPLKSPVPGAPIQDGFLIGFSDSNETPSQKTTSVTRLAFPNTANGKFEREGVARHKGGVYTLSVSGSIKKVTPEKAEIKMLRNGDVQGIWSVPLSESR